MKGGEGEGEVGREGREGAWTFSSARGYKKRV